MPQTMTIGLDLGDRKSHYCILDDGGDVLSRGEVPSTKQGMERFFRRHPDAVVVMEAGTHSRWVSSLLERLGVKAIVANPGHVRLIYAGNNKTDQFDAENLARLARVDVRLLHPVTHRSDQAQADLAIVKARDILVGARKDVINHFRAAVKVSGERIVGCAADSVARKAAEHIPDILRPALSHLLTSIEELTTQIKAIEKLIERTVACSYPETKRLMQVAGVGPITALTFVLTLEDKHRFDDPRMVGAFLGLVPRRAQSGDRDPQLHITKAGNGYLRRLLVNCAHYITGPLGPDSDLKSFALRLAPTKDKNRRKRAVVAVARKLSVLLYSLWRTGSDYVPVGFATRAA